MNVQIITPEKTLFDAQAAMVTVPGADGEFGVLPGHSHVISTLKPGEIVADLENGEQRRFAVQGGIAEITSERITLLIEAA